MALALILVMIAATVFSTVAGALDRIGYPDHAITVGVIAATVAVFLAIGMVIRLRRHPPS